MGTKRGGFSPSLLVGVIVMLDISEEFRQEAERILRWRNLWNLIPMWTNVFYMPERIYEYNPTLFVCWNKLSQKYEIHSIAGGPNVSSREAVLDFDELDVRALYYLWERDIRVHGVDIFRRIEESQRRAQERRKKAFENHVQALARETRNIFRHLSYGFTEYTVPKRGEIRYNIWKMKAGVSHANDTWRNSGASGFFNP